MKTFEEFHFKVKHSVIVRKPKTFAELEKDDWFYKINTSVNKIRKIQILKIEYADGDMVITRYYNEYTTTIPVENINETTIIRRNNNIIYTVDDEVAEKYRKKLDVEYEIQSKDTDWNTW